MEHTIPVSCLVLSFCCELFTRLLTRSRIHSFPASNLLSSSPSLTQAITCLTQSPAIDVVGIGFTSGEISVYDIRADERLMRMFMEGGVRALGFRSGEPVLNFTNVVLISFQMEKRFLLPRLLLVTLRSGTSTLADACCIWYAVPMTAPLLPWSGFLDSPFSSLLEKTTA